MKNYDSLESFYNFLLKFSLVLSHLLKSSPTTLDLLLTVKKILTNYIHGLKLQQAVSVSKQLSTVVLSSFIMMMHFKSAKKWAFLN